MIIYGTKAHPLKSDLLPNETCTNCNTKGKIVMSIFSKYAHIFWIPIFPVGRVGVSTCMNCQQTLVSKDMPMYLKMQYEQTVPQTKVPWWTWSGLGLIAILIGSAVYANKLDDENYKKYIAAPQAGDLYSFKTEDGYSMMRVAEVRPDSLLIQFNEYIVDKKSGIQELKTKDFDSLAVWIDRGMIKAMYDSSKIFQVER